MNSTPPFRYHGLDHLVLEITAIDRSLHFYVEVLGMKLERIIEDVGIDHLCVLLDGDVNAIVDHLAAHDVPVEWGPVELYGATGFGSSIYVLDPDGHTIELELELELDHADFPLRTAGRHAAAVDTRRAAVFMPCFQHGSAGNWKEPRGARHDTIGGRRVTLGWGQEIPFHADSCPDVAAVPGRSAARRSGAGRRGRPRDQPNLRTGC